jgi:hypothetical protein
VWLRRASAPTAPLPAASADVHAVTNIDYNAKGQRTKIELGNGVHSDYVHDELTLRLLNLTTTRPDTFAAAERTVQDLRYTYDPVGNITHLQDDADLQDVVFFRNQRVEPSADYVFDALYRLVKATGREHLGRSNGVLNPPSQTTNDDGPRVGLAHPNDGTAMGNYVERYQYDLAGNLLSTAHQAASGGWSRLYSYAEPSLIEPGKMSNRLSATSLPGDAAAGPYSARYSYDEHGSMKTMPHLPSLAWDFEDRLQATTAQAAGPGVTPETTYFVYDAAGRRVRKVTNRQAGAGAAATRKAERIYLDGIEVYREYQADGTTRTLERESLHVLDGERRVALIETKTLDTADPTDLNVPLARYQHGNVLDSAILELDQSGNVISYE